MELLEFFFLGLQARRFLYGLVFAFQFVKLGLPSSFLLLLLFLLEFQFFLGVLLSFQFSFFVFLIFVLFL